MKRFIAYILLTLTVFLGIGVLLYIFIICFVCKYLIKKLEKFKRIEYIMFIIFTIIYL